VGESRLTSLWKLGAIALAVAVPVAVGGSYVLSWLQQPIDSDQPLQATETRAPFQNTPMIRPGLRMPATIKAHEADLADDESVIGVTADGRHRAYRVKAMRPVDSHVINDLIGDVPVTVTYDDRTDFSQVFVGDTNGRPMNVDMGAYFNGMLVRVGTEMIRQDTGRAMAEPGKEGPQRLTIMAHTRTEWKAWRTTFPDTDVYAGPK
jgi:hypothetical protein